MFPQSTCKLQKCQRHSHNNKCKELYTMLAPTHSNAQRELVSNHQILLTLHQSLLILTTLQAAKLSQPTPSNNVKIFQ